MKSGDEGLMLRFLPDVFGKNGQGCNLPCHKGEGVKRRLICRDIVECNVSDLDIKLQVV